MNKSPEKSTAIWTGIVCGMASYVDAAIIVSWGIVLVIYQNIFSLNSAQFGTLSGLLTFCIAIGALCGGYLGDRFGRRSVFISMMIAVVVSVTGMLVLPTYFLMAIFTVLVGLSSGAVLPVSLTTIAEASDDKQRGTLLGLSQILWLFGAIVPSILSVIVGNNGLSGAKIILGHILVVTVLVILGRITVPESAGWKEANAARKEGGRGENAEKKNQSLSLLFRAPYLVPLLALMIFYGLCNAAYNVFGQFGTYILVNVVKIDVSTASSAALIALPFALVGSMLFMKTVRGKRRNFYFFLGVIGTSIGILIPVIFGITFNNYLVTLAILFFANSFAGEAMMKVWSQESFPTLLRATGQGVVIAVGRFAAAAFAFVVPLIIAYNPVLLFIIMAVICLVGGLTAWAVFRTAKPEGAILGQEAVEG